MQKLKSNYGNVLEEGKQLLKLVFFSRLSIQLQSHEILANLFNVFPAFAYDECNWRVRLKSALLHESKHYVRSLRRPNGQFIVIKTTLIYYFTKSVYKLVFPENLKRHNTV